MSQPSSSATGQAATAGAGAGPQSAAGTEAVGVLALRLAAGLGGVVEMDPGGAGGAGVVSGYGPQITFGADDGRFRSGVTPLLEYGLLKVHGVEAAAFLQAQLTNDVATLEEGEVRLAGYCSVKGRLMASFWIWRDADRQTFWLACSRDIAAATARRLSMFVLRAKVKVEDVSDRVALLGIVRAADGGVAMPAQVLLKAAEVPLPPVTLAAALVAALASSSGGVQAEDAPAAVQASAAVEAPAEAVVARALLPVDAEALEQTLADLKAGGVRLLSTDVWRRLEVLSGVARINASNRELFVPQMVNFELVGGVNFKKGCYPGQEIVARSQYLGKLKRRMFLGVGAGAAPAAGTDVDVEGEVAVEPVGQVVMAANLGAGERFAVLFESLTAAVPTTPGQPEAGLRIGRSPINSLPLPYPVPAAAPAGGRPAASPRGPAESAAASAASSAPSAATGPDAAS